MQKQTIWMKSGESPEHIYDLHVFTSTDTDFTKSVDIISSKNYPILQDLKFGDVVEVEIRIKGRK